MSSWIDADSKQIYIEKYILITFLRNSAQKQDLILVDETNLLKLRDVTYQVIIFRAKS